MRKVIPVSDVIIYFYFVLTLSLFAFVNFTGAIGALVIVVPHFNGKVVILHFGLTCVVFVLYFLLKLLSREKVVVDSILICLIIKCACDLVPILTSDFRIDGYFGHYSVTVSSAACYFLYSNLTLYDKLEVKLQYLFVLFGVVIAIQTALAAVLSGLSYFDIFYKSCIVIPYGASNVISSILVPVFCMAYLWKEQKIRRLSLIIISLGIILTKSRGGMALYICCFFFLTIKRIRGRWRSLIILAIAFLFVTGLGIAFTNEKVQQIARGYATGAISLNSITSGRLNLWINNINKYFSDNHVLFGLGMPSVSAGYKESHNLIIDIFLRCGIVGIIYYGVLFFSFFKNKVNEPFGTEIEDNVWFVMCCIVLVNSMYELCYFSYNSDVLFYTMMGLSTAKQHTMRKKDKLRYGQISEALF